MVDRLLHFWRSNPKTVLVIFAALAWCIWISGIFGNAGLLQAYRLADARFELQMKIKALETENIRLEHAHNLLENDPITQERAIRDTIGFVKSDELVFEFR